MSFEIYFDESHKLDKHTSDYSYYGAIGCDRTTRKKFDSFIEELDIKGELHFRDFNLDKINNYLKPIEYAVDKFYGNFYIVNSSEAYRIGDKIGIEDKSKLREIFYIKIPERLIYGITRRIRDFKTVNIYIDKSAEYEKYELEKKLKSQLNAQSIYRNLQYSIDKVEQIDSKYSRMIQIADIILGIVVFLFEEKYRCPIEELKPEEMDRIKTCSQLSVEEKDFIEQSYTCKVNKIGEKTYIINVLSEEQSSMNKLKQIFKKINLYSQKSIQKSELIYRFLMKHENLKNFYDFNIFLWSTDFNEDQKVSKGIKSNNSKEVQKDHISKYVSQFFQFKTEFDNYNRLSLLDYHHNNSPSSEKEYTRHMGWGSSLKLLTRRYLNELNIK